jgi:hypothetical protein
MHLLTCFGEPAAEIAADPAGAHDRNLHEIVSAFFGNPTGDHPSGLRAPPRGSMRLGLTGGQAHNNRLCSTLLQQLPRDARLLADRGYGADWIRSFTSPSSTRMHSPVATGL